MDAILEELMSDDSVSDLMDSETDISIIFSSDSSSTDSEEERDNHPNSINFLNIISSYDDKDFKKHFRLHRCTVNQLIDKCRNSDVIQNQQKGGWACIGVEKEIYIFLWYMSNTNTFREIANLFGTSKSGAWHVVVKVSNWLITIGHNYIKWPARNEVPNMTALWEHRKKFPSVIGAIDCTHIKIKAPNENKQCYFNRKHYYSVHLQAVVDINKKFIDIFVGEPGSLHDSRVLRKSELYRHALMDKENTFPYTSLILGDSAYPSLEWLVTPFKDNGHLSNEEVQFNIIHSSARIVVENAFGMLKTRFRRLLHFTEQTNINLVVNLIVAGCILHNICLEENDENDFEDDSFESSEVNEPNEEQEVFSGNNRRQQLLNYLITKGCINVRN